MIKTHKPGPNRILRRIQNFFRSQAHTNEIAALEERLESQVQVLDAKLDQGEQASTATQKTLRRMHLSLGHYSQVLKDIQKSLADLQSKQAPQMIDEGQRYLQLAPQVMLKILDQTSRNCNAQAGSHELRQILNLINWTQVAKPGQAYHPIDTDENFISILNFLAIWNRFDSCPRIGANQEWKYCRLEHWSNRNFNAATNFARSNSRQKLEYDIFPRPYKPCILKPNI